MKVKSNYHWNNFLYGYELTEKEKEDYDYLDSEELENGSFLRYRKNVYYIGDFMHFDKDSKTYESWHGYFPESYFSAVVIRISEDSEQYQVGLALS